MKKLTAVLLVFFALPAAAQEGYSPLQQYLYNESGYAPPQMAPAPAPENVAVADPYYQQQVPVYDAAPDTYYEDEASTSDSESAGLRAMLTSSGL